MFHGTVCATLVFMMIMLHLVWLILFLAEGKYISAEQTQNIIIDTDAGSDDAVAIFLALNAQAVNNNFEISAVTLVNGNTNVDNVGRNVLKILKTANRLDIPIYKGLNYSLVKTPPSDNYFGNDGLGDFPFPDPPTEDLIQNETAANFLVNKVRSNRGIISIICLGPLTNIALAMRNDESFLRNVKEIIFLGGSVNGGGNVKPGVEFNIYMDPEASYIVMSEAAKLGKLIKMVPIETAKQAYISWDWRTNVLGSLQSPTIDFINKAEAIINDGGRWSFADSIAVALTILPELSYTSMELYGFTSIDGVDSRGSTIMDYSGDIKQPKQLTVVIPGSLNVTAFQDIFVKYLG